MPTVNYIEKIIGMQEVEVKKIENEEKKITIYIERYRQECICPVCGRKTVRVHDYRWQKVKELPAFGKDVELRVHKRRYACECGKRFHEPCPFLGKYQRRTTRTTMAMLERLSDIRAYSTVANEFGVSAPTVMRVFNNISYPKPTVLPEVVGIDEFKGNTGGEKYNCILTDVGRNCVLDVVKSRKQADLCKYFKEIDRSKVKYFVSDMYVPYAEIAKTYFPNATYVIDKYHWIRQAIWAFENVRKEVQKKFSRSHRIYFKHSRKLLLKHERDLKQEELEQVSVMLGTDANLSTAYFLKELLYRLLDETNPDVQKKKLSEWIDAAIDSEIIPFKKCAYTYLKWFTPIVNSFYCHHTNAFTEGFNNKIKVLKRNAFGLRNFRRFRNRILFCASANRAQL